MPILRPQAKACWQEIDETDAYLEAEEKLCYKNDIEKAEGGFNVYCTR